jgi:hypothetical protein
MQRIALSNKVFMLGLYDLNVDIACRSPTMSDFSAT